MNSGRSHNSLNFAVSMTLFAVFALFLTMVLLTGASAFKGLSTAVEERYSERTILLYLSQKVRMSDAAESVNIAEYDGIPMLVLTTGAMNAYIYTEDGYLTELYGWSDEQPDFSVKGTPILPAENVGFEKVTASLIKITVGGNSTFVHLSSDTGGGR
ncbi:MAG: DUF4860 domain-containing protein [Oscillospiraceae bacterium]|nr:DUF4860 domain-containing protein [Oscillospiraceae bacterium]